MSQVKQEKATEVPGGPPMEDPLPVTGTNESKTVAEAITPTPTTLAPSPEAIDKGNMETNNKVQKLEMTPTTPTTPIPESKTTESKTTTKASPISPSSLSIMERAAAAKEQQRQYLAAKGEQISEGKKSGEGKNNFGGSGPPKGMPPPPGKWGGSGPPPKNETAKQKRDRQRREQDAKRLRQSSKFASKRPVSASRKGVIGETKEEKLKRRQDALDEKKKQRMSRFSPAQQKLLKRGKQSRDYWSKQKPSKKENEEKSEREKKEKEKNDAVKNKNNNNGSTKNGNGKTDMNDIWRACETGDVKFIKSHVQHSRWDVRRHHDRGPKGFGATPLHKACWGCHPLLVQWLLEHVERKYGKDELLKYVNCIDSQASKVTPLLEACRTKVGFMKDRLNVLNMLLKNGANLRSKDVHGDNCLHWAARTGSLPVVRFLLKMTEGAVWASMDENILRKRPIDLALEQCCDRVKIMTKNESDDTADVRVENVPSSEPLITVAMDDLFPLPLHGTDENIMLLATHRAYARDAVYAQLLRLVQGSNVRLKIQRNRERRENDKKRRILKIQSERENIIELARSTCMDAEAEWIRQRESATTVRQLAEDAFVQQIMNKEIVEATSFLDSTEGKREYKKRATEIQNRRKEHALSKGLPKPKRLPAREANALAKKELINERAESARKQGIRDFRRKNTHKFERREEKALEKEKKIMHEED